MDDLISRQAALDAIDKNRQDLLSLGMDGAEHILVHYGRRVIEELPTAERVGKWIEVKNKWGGLGIICSECGAQVPRDGWGSAMQSAYCYRCGARMEGEDDDSDKD